MAHSQNKTWEQALEDVRVRAKGSGARPTDLVHRVERLEKEADLLASIFNLETQLADLLSRVERLERRLSDVEYEAQ